MYLWPVYQSNFINDEHCHVALRFSMQYVNNIRYGILDVKSVSAKLIWQLHKTFRTPLCIFFSASDLSTQDTSLPPQVQHTVKLV